jgi:zinc protease
MNTPRIGKSPLLLAMLLLVAISSPAESGESDGGSGKAEGSKSKKGASVTVPKITFEKFTLPNGLQVILHVDRKLPVVHVNQWYHVGSKNEKLNRTGFAHLFEHMMFQGSANATGEYFSYAERAGANLREGGINGTTDPDRTNYFATVPSSNLEFLLWLESDRLATLSDSLTQRKLDNQRDVVKNERRQGLENQPYGRWSKLLVENLYPKGHPYSWDVIGIHEDLTAATLDDVKEFFRTYYTPNNLSLTIAGDFDTAEAKSLVEKYFGSIPPGPALDRPARWVPTLEGEKIIEVNDRVPQARTYLAWPAFPYFEPGDAELDLAAAILTDGLSSRLNKILVYEKQLCSDVGSYNWTAEISSLFFVQATARPGASLPEIEEIITQEIGRLARKGPTPEELERAKTKWEYRFVTDLERIGGFGGKADRLNQYNTYLGDPGKFDEDVARYVNATTASVREAVANRLYTPNRLVVRFHPETSGRQSASTLDRAKAPDLGADRPFHAPEVKTARLPNDLQVFVVERPELPKVSVEIATRAGTAADPAGKEGVANLVATTIDLGTKTKKALVIEEELGDLGTAVEGSAGREYASLSFEVLKRNLVPAITIVADVVRHPTFPDSEVEREKKLLLDDLAQEANDPGALAARIGPMLAFGYDHPYGRPSRGLPASVQKISRGDLAQFHETYWKPGGSALVFVGDITLDEATEVARAAFADWTGGAPPAVVIPEPRPVGPGKVYIVDRQDAAQTMVGLILPAPKRKTEDYYALRLVNSVWGGAFQSRLNLNLREDKGYSYGSFAYVVQHSTAGVWFASGGVQTDKTKESVTEFVNELKDVAGKRPISAQELADAKSNRVRGYSQQFESLSRIGGQVRNLWVWDLPMSELQQEAEETEKTTLAEVNDAAKKYAVPGQCAILLVGDRSKIEAGVRDLKLGEIVVLDAEGELVAER